MKLSDKAQKSLDRVIERFKNGDLSAITKVTRINLAENAPARNWSLSNKVISFVQSGELDCRGFKQWEKIGRKIKKGSKAVYILRPVTIKTLKEDNGEHKEEYSCIGFSSVPVFAASSTEGDTPLQAYQPKNLPQLMEVAKKFKISVKYVPLSPDRLGDCTSDGKNIRLGSHTPAVFFHELAHAIHAHIEGKLQGNQNVEQETVAEFSAAVLMDLYDYQDHSGNAWDYISHYAKDPLIAISKAMRTIEKVLEILLDTKTN